MFPYIPDTEAEFLGCPRMADGPERAAARHIGCPLQPFENTAGDDANRFAAAGSDRPFFHAGPTNAEAQA